MNLKEKLEKSLKALPSDLTPYVRKDMICAKCKSPLTVYIPKGEDYKTVRCGKCV